MRYLTRGSANTSLSPAGDRAVPLAGPGNTAAPIIRRTATAAIGPYIEGDVPTAAFTPAAYASSAGTPIVTRTWRVNGAVVPATTVLVAGDAVQVQDSVTDSAGTPARLFRYGPVVVAALPASGWVFAGDFDGTIQRIPPVPAWVFAGDFDGTIISIPELHA